MPGGADYVYLPGFIDDIKLDSGKVDVDYEQLESGVDEEGGKTVVDILKDMPGKKEVNITDIFQRSIEENEIFDLLDVKLFNEAELI